MLTPQQESMATTVVEDLTTFLHRGQAEVAMSFAVWGAGNVKDASLKNLADDWPRIVRLKGELLDAARKGTSYNFSDWASYAETLHSDIAFNAGMVGSWDLSGALWGVASGTYQDVKKVAEDVADVAKSVGGGTGIGIGIGLLLVGIVAWKLS